LLYSPLVTRGVTLYIGSEPQCDFSRVQQLHVSEPAIAMQTIPNRAIWKLRAGDHLVQSKYALALAADQPEFFLPMLPS